MTNLMSTDNNNNKMNDKQVNKTSEQSKDKCEANKQQENNDQEDDVELDDRTNLDSGYAWFILLIMFLLQSSISGASRVYGIVYAKEVAIGYYDREEASTPIATASAIENLAGVLTPALAQRLSWRKIELLSTLLFVGANLLAYFSCSLSVDILALGIIQGLALSTSTVLSLAINNDYFERYRTSAFGISMSGSTFGVLYLSPLVSWLLRDYDDFRLVYLMLSMVFSVNIILVLFIKPRAKTIRNKKNKKQQQQQQQQDEMTKAATLNCEEEVDLSNLKTQLTRFESRFERQNSIASISYRARSRRQSVLSRSMTATSGDLHSAADHSGGSLKLVASGHHRKPLDQELISGSGGGALSQRQLNCCLQMNAGHLMLSKSVSSAADLFRNLEATKQENQNKKKISVNSNDNQIFMTIDSKLADEKQNNYHGGGESRQEEVIGTKQTEKNLEEGDHLQQLSRKKSSMVVFNGLGGDQTKQTRDNNNNNNNNNNKERQTKVAKVTKVNETNKSQQFSMEIVLTLLKLPYLHCAWIMLALYYLIARIFIIILVDFADDHGFNLTESTNLLNYWSLGELCGRILLGSLIDLKWMSCKSCISLTCSLISFLIMAMILIESYYVYAACSLLIAALISLEYMLINVMIVEYLGKSKVTSCYSIAAFISSLILFARPSLIGLFRDQLGSYDGLLWLLASISLTYAILFQLLEPLLVRKWPKTGELI